MPTTVDLLFPVVGSRFPTDHAYGVFAGCCRLLPCLHDGSFPFALAPITGSHIGAGLLQLDPHRSRLRLRLPVTDVPRVLPLAGKRLEVMGHRIRLGVPQVAALTPAPSVIARTVAIKKATTVEPFLQAARKQLDQLGIAGRLRVPEHASKTGHREPTRHVLRVKEVRIVCFSLLVDGLQPDESVRLQEFGLGGRRHLGCGVFVPAREGGAA